MRMVSCSIPASRSARVGVSSRSQAVRSVPAAPRIPVSGVRRSCDSDVQQRRAQLLRLGLGLGARRRHRPAAPAPAPPPPGRARRRAPGSRSDPESPAGRIPSTPSLAARRAQRQEPPERRRQRGGAAPGRLVGAQGPARGRPAGRIHRIDRRDGGADVEILADREQHQTALRRFRRPHAPFVQQTPVRSPVRPGRLNAVMRRRPSIRPCAVRAALRRRLAIAPVATADTEEQHDRDKIARLVDGEPVERRDEEEVPAHERQHRGEERHRRPQMDAAKTTAARNSMPSASCVASGSGPRSSPDRRHQRQAPQPGEPRLRHARQHRSLRRASAGNGTTCRAKSGARSNRPRITPCRSRRPGEQPSPCRREGRGQ